MPNAGQSRMVSNRAPRYVEGEDPLSHAGTCIMARYTDSGHAGRSGDKGGVPECRRCASLQPERRKCAIGVAMISGGATEVFIWHAYRWDIRHHVPGSVSNWSTGGRPRTCVAGGRTSCGHDRAEGSSGIIRNPWPWMMRPTMRSFLLATYWRCRSPWRWR